MANGLLMGIEEFESLPQKQKMNCLYENQVRTLQAVGTYKLHQKIQYPWLVFLSGLMIFLLKTGVTG